MRWILLDVVLALLALGALVLVGLSLWRRVTALGRQVTLAGETLGAAAANLEVQRTPTGQGHGSVGSGVST